MDLIVLKEEQVLDIEKDIAHCLEVQNDKHLIEVKEVDCMDDLSDEDDSQSLIKPVYFKI